MSPSVLKNINSYSKCAQLSNSLSPPYTENEHQGSTLAYEYGHFPKFFSQSHDVVQSSIKLKLFHFLMTFLSSSLSSIQSIWRNLVLPHAFRVIADGFSTDCPSCFICTYKGNLLGDGMMLDNTNSALYL